ncbi:phage tail protein [Streptomyces violaceoruber]|uniref:phage tail protein n=1 Tax=Streptomyces violaceoruber TaxID=1935 RepID=UPI003B429D7C
MADDPDLTGHVRLDLRPLIEALRFAQAVTRRQIRNMVRDANQALNRLDTDGVRARLSTLVSGINLSPLVSGIGRAVGVAARLAVPFAAAGAAVGSLVPLLAGVTAALAQMAPAAALAVSGVLAIGLAAGTVKIAMEGVGDAVKAALDPSDPEAYAEAVKKLSPNARSFVGEIRKAQPALAAIRKSVQEKVFDGLDKQLRSTAKAALPEFRSALGSTATTLNKMATGVFTATRGLAKDGTLGTALKGATTGLNEFRRAPGQVVTALGQIGAAAAPAFARLSKAGGSALDRLSARLTKAFESGGMERAIEGAIDLLGQLGRVIGNVAGIFGNLFKGVTAGGQGLFGTLETITGSLREATATAGFQRALRALSDTMRVVASTVGPLLGQALAVLGPVVEALAGPVQTLVTTLGSGLSTVLTALGPVLAAAATAFGDLIVALTPFVTLAAEILAGALRALVPLFEGLGGVIQAMTPFLAQLATNIGAQLLPVLERLPEILGMIVPVFEQAAAEIFPELTNVLVTIAPYLRDLAVQLADLAVQLTPVIARVLELSTLVARKLAPYLGPLLAGVIVGLIAILSGLVTIVQTAVVPVLRTFARILSGDLAGAARTARGVLEWLQAGARSVFVRMVGEAAQAVGRLASELGLGASRAAARLRDGLLQGVHHVRTLVGSLPGIARAAAGAMGSALVAAGASLISGLIAGIQSKIGAVRAKLGELTSMIPNWKGPKRRDAKLLTPAGKSIIRGLIDGITATTPKLKSTLTSITNTIERAISVNKGNRRKLPGLSSLLKRVEKDNKRLLSLAKSRDKVAASLATAQKKLDDLVKERAKRAADIRDGILGEANITSGHNLVNSISAITVGLQVAVKKTQQFTANLAKLRKAGLRSDLLDDIGDAGVDGGAATAEALAKATPAELKRINELQAQLAKAATSTGASVAGALYDSGVRAAQGLVDGLKKQQKSIEKQMEKIAAAMVKAIKKALKIKSPSRVFMGVGEMSGAGLREGMLRSRQSVAAASTAMARAAVGAADVASRAFATIPAPGQMAAAYAGAGGGGDTHHTWHLHGSDATPDGILHALSWNSLVRRRG